jgi:hypothetical protein
LISPVRAPGNSRISLASSDGSFAVFPPVSAAAVICTGAKHGPTFSTVRAWHRHVNTTLAATPLRRATSVTLAPGAKVSSTIRVWSSSDQHRRRSTPPKNLDPHRLMTLKLDLRSHAPMAAIDA